MASSVNLSWAPSRLGWVLFEILVPTRYVIFVINIKAILFFFYAAWVCSLLQLLRLLFKIVALFFHPCLNFY